MMWSILKIYIGIGLLTNYYVHGTGWNIPMAIKRRELIDGIFRPINEIEIVKGSDVKVFKGVNMFDNCDVIMKFCYNSSECKREFEIYSYLGAIDKREVEKYGISPIYYYNECENVSLIVLPLFECNLKQKASKFELETIDYLILFRDFVRQSKYIHSHGIRHNNVKPDNIMLRRGRSFLIDFNAGSKMHEYTTGHLMKFGSGRLHRQQSSDGPLQPGQLRTPLDDWESFLYTMADVYNDKLKWFNELNYQGYFPKMLLHEMENEKSWTDNIIRNIVKNVKCEHLKEVFVEFANEVFKEDGSLPRYNDFEKFITDKIEYMIEKNQPAIFSWLEGRERNEAIEDLRNNPPATVEQIPKPKATYLKTDYKTPEYKHFEKRRNTMVTSAEGNHQRYLKEEDVKDLQKETERMKLEAENEKMKKKRTSGNKTFLSKCLPSKHY